MAMALLIQPFGNAAVTTTTRTRRCSLTCTTGEPLVTGVLARWDSLRISWRADADIQMISRQTERRMGRPRKEHTMPARTPDEICRLFRQYMHGGDLDAVMTLYDREAVFVNQAG
jgi:hypothetical protein